MFNNIATKAQCKTTAILTDGSSHKEDGVHLPDVGDTNLNLNARRRRVKDIRSSMNFFKLGISMLPVVWIRILFFNLMFLNMCVLRVN